MTDTGAVLLARGHLHRAPPAPVKDPLVGSMWMLARHLGHEGEALRLDLRHPRAIRVSRSPTIWGQYWPGFDRAELGYRTRHSLASRGPRQPQIVLGGPSGAVAACQRAASRLRAAVPLDAHDLVALLTLLHELHHASSAHRLAGHDYALAYERDWQLEEGFVHGMSVRRLLRILHAEHAPIRRGAISAFRAWASAHELAAEYRAVRRVCRDRGSFEAGWREYRAAGLMERLYFRAPVPAFRRAGRVREKRARAAA